MKNNFPKIYSLSTIGIKQHYNADYPFHYIRTDFSGESGSGKSMVSDMLQLILIGSGNFESSTDGNKPREVKGMLLTNKGKSSGRGYMFLNIEMKPNKFLVIGAYIESTSNQSELFIIQNGYDWENFIFLDKPFYSGNLIFNKKTYTISVASEKIENAYLKTFNRKQYHQILYDNQVVSLNLTKTDTLKSYASILRSFSRGKGFKVDSKSLKNFLFGRDDQNVIKQKYDEEVNNINNDFYEHKRYSEEINLINKKQKLIQEVLNKQKYYTKLFKEYLNIKLNYWNKLEKEAVAKKETYNIEYFNCLIESSELNKSIKIIELQNIEKLKTQRKELINLGNEAEVKKVREKAQEEYRSILRKKEITEKVQEWFDSNDNNTDKVKSWFEQERKKNNDFKKLNKFINFLNDNKIIEEFKKSDWFLNFERAEDLYKSDIISLQNKIDDLTTLSKFSDISNKESLSAWAFENLDFPVDEINESILIYFQKFSKDKPVNAIKGTRYLPFPNELFESLDIKNKSKKGFWLNLDGVYEFIGWTPYKYLNVDNPESIKKNLKEQKEDISKNILKLEEKKKSKVKLKETLFKHGNSEYSIDLFKRKNEVLKYKIDSSIDIEKVQFDDYISIYNDRKRLFEDFNKVELNWHNAIERDKYLKRIQENIEEKENYFFKQQMTISAEMIAEKILTIKNKIREIDIEIDKKVLKFNIDKKRIINESKIDFDEQNLSILLKDQVGLNKIFLEKEEVRKNNLKTISIAETEIKDVHNSYFNSFYKKLKIVKIEVNENPEEGSNSLKDKVNRAKMSFEENYNLIKKESNNPNFGDTYDIGILAHQLLPTVFKTSKINEELINENITERLNKLTNDIQEIGSRKIEILKRIFNDVYKVYNEYLTKLALIDGYLKNRKITGGNKASLSYTKSIDYPINWLTPFRKQLDNQLSNVGLFKNLKEEIDINKMMIKAFKESGGSSKVQPDDLINPKSYFDLEFDLKLENGDVNSGSNGQTYTGNALLALARLSLIEDKVSEGIKIMPIDEAEGLGGNYDMLHELAKKEGYQLITMGIETAGDIIEGEQYIYIMNENKITDYETFVPPLAIFSEGEVIEDISQHIIPNE